MRAIIAGSRTGRMGANEKRWLGTLGITEVVCGGARGIDRHAYIWAYDEGIPCRVFPADWRQHGRAAGPIRNAQMAEYLAEFIDSIVVLFPGNSGTASMRREAKMRGLKIVEWRR